MTERKPDKGLDIEALRFGIEQCEPDLIVRYYAENAELRIVNADAPQNAPFELRGMAEISKHLRAVFGQKNSHLVEREVVDENRVTFRDTCEYPDGSRVRVETTLEVRDGKIIRQVDVASAEAQADRKDKIDQRSPIRKTHSLPAQDQMYLPPTVFYASNRQPNRRISDDVSSIERAEAIPDHHVLRHSVCARWWCHPVRGLQSGAP